MAAVNKCGHCGSRDTQTLGRHIKCLVCGGWTDSEGRPTDNAYA